MKKTFFDEFLNITNELDTKLENFEKLEQEFVGIKKEYSLNPNSLLVQAMLSSYASRYKSLLNDIKILRMRAQKLQQV